MNGLEINDREDLSQLDDLIRWILRDGKFQILASQVDWLVSEISFHLCEERCPSKYEDRNLTLKNGKRLLIQDAIDKAAAWTVTKDFEGTPHHRLADVNPSVIDQFQAIWDNATDDEKNEIRGIVN